MINTLLATSKDAPIPFSFLVNGRFLTTSLAEYLTEHGLSAESVLEVEYIRAALPPTPQASFEHDDWVSCVDVLSASSPAGQDANSDVRSGHERILSASYDGVVRVWDMTGSVVAQSSPIDSDMPAHLLAARFISHSRIASAGFDSKIHIHSLDPSSSALSPTLTLLGHRHIVTSLAAHAPSQRLLSASSDNTAMLWSTTTSLPPVPDSLPAHIVSTTSTLASGKRRKTSTPGNTPRAGPLLTLAKHTRPVTGAIFAPHDSTIGYTASADRTLLTWDLTTATAVSSRVPAAHEPLSCLAAFAHSAAGASGMLVAGTGTGSVLVVDPREGVQRAVVARGRAHRHGVTGVDVAPASDASAGYSFVSSARGGGEVFVWDVRNTAGGAVVELAGADDAAGGARALAPTFRVERQRRAEHKEGWAVLGVCWDVDVGIVSGGQDKRVQIDRARS